MKYLLIIFISIKSSVALAAFLEFVVVEPESEHAKWLNIAVKINEPAKTCIISFDTSWAVWLINASKDLSQKEQEFRNLVWGLDKPIYVKSISRLASTLGDNKRYSASVSAEQASRSYIYMDSPNFMLDGGFYYSIPLKTFCAEKP